EQVEEDRHGARVRQHRQRHEQPRLPQDDQQRGDVDRVAHPAVGPGRDNAPRRVPETGSAMPHGREVPDTPQVQGRPGRDDRDRLPRDRGGGAPVARHEPPGSPDSPSPGTTTVNTRLRTMRLSVRAILAHLPIYSVATYNATLPGRLPGRNP